MGEFNKPKVIIDQEEYEYLKKIEKEFDNLLSELTNAKEEKKDVQ